MPERKKERAKKKYPKFLLLLNSNIYSTQIVVFTCFIQYVYITRRKPKVERERFSIKIGKMLSCIFFFVHSYSSVVVIVQWFFFLRFCPNSNICNIHDINIFLAGQTLKSQLSAFALPKSQVVNFARCDFCLPMEEPYIFRPFSLHHKSQCDVKWYWYR